LIESVIGENVDKKGTIAGMEPEGAGKKGKRLVDGIRRFSARIWGERRTANPRTGCKKRGPGATYSSAAPSTYVKKSVLRGLQSPLNRWVRVSGFLQQKSVKGGVYYSSWEVDTHKEAGPSNGKDGQSAEGKRSYPENSIGASTRAGGRKFLLITDL